MPKQYDLFISHSSKDEPLAKLLVDTLLTNGCDVSVNDILCTSLEGMKIPNGTPSFIEFLREKLQKPKLTILLLSENYFESTFCVCELGAAWGLGLETFILVVPPLKKSEVKGAVKVTQATGILDADDLGELKDRIRDVLGKTTSTPRWGVMRDEFLRKADAVIKSLPTPDSVKREKLDAALAQYQEVLKRSAEKDSEIKVLKSQISDLKKCKDRTAVVAVELKYSTDEEQFKKLCSRAKKALGNLERATCKSIFWTYKSDHYRPKGDEELSELRDAIAEDQVYDPDDGGCSPNEDHVGVSIAMKAVKKLHSWLDGEESSPAFFKHMGQEYGFPISVTNRSFWKTFLVPV